MKTIYSSRPFSIFSMAITPKASLAIAVFTLMFFAISAAPINAQISIAALNTAYSQNFNGMGTTDLTITDDVTGSLPGFHAFREVGNTNPNLVEADDGSGLTGNFKNYGQSNQIDRALGMLPDASTGFLRFGARFINDTGVPINSITVTYTGEQWHVGSLQPQAMAFAYRTAASVNDLTTGVYTAVPNLTFTSPVLSAFPGQVDGNQAGNRATFTVTFAVTVPAGEEIMLRWEMTNEAGDDHGLAVDDLTVTAQGASTAAPATISGRVADSNGRAISRTRVILQGGNLTELRTALTNAFGYYQFDNVETGESYTLRVETKRYRFENPTIFVNLGEDATGLDFIANP